MGDKWLDVRGYLNIRARVRDLKWYSIIHVIKMLKVRYFKLESASAIFKAFIYEFRNQARAWFWTCFPYFVLFYFTQGQVKR